MQLLGYGKESKLAACYTEQESKSRVIPEAVSFIFTDASDMTLIEARGVGFR